MEKEQKRNIIAKVKISNGKEYVFFDDGSICEVVAPGEYKRVNELIDKDDRLKSKILKQFDDSHNSDIVKSKGEINLDTNIDDNFEEVELPEL